MPNQKIAKDKWRHFYAGMVLTLVIHFLLEALFSFPFWTGIAINFGISCAIAYGFELFSKITSLGRYDFMDTVATVIGSIVSIIVIVICWYTFS